MLLCLVLTPVFAQQSMWLETDTQTEIKMSLRLQKKNNKTCGGSRECCRSTQRVSPNWVRKTPIITFPVCTMILYHNFCNFLTHSYVYQVRSLKNSCLQVSDSSETETELESFLTEGQFLALIELGIYAIQIGESDLMFFSLLTVFINGVLTQIAFPL